MLLKYFCTANIQQPKTGIRRRSNKQFCWPFEMAFLMEILQKTLNRLRIYFECKDHWRSWTRNKYQSMILWGKRMQPLQNIWVHHLFLACCLLMTRLPFSWSRMLPPVPKALMCMDTGCRGDICAEWVRIPAEYEWVEKNWEPKLFLCIHGVDACGYRNGCLAHE